VLTGIIVTLLIVVAIVYAAVPLLFPRQVDPLPDERDPILLDLEEDREALFRAIRELDAREDVVVATRDRLRARYEAKAAGVLRAIDERRAVLRGTSQPPEPSTRRGLPWASLTLLAVMGLSAAALGPFVLPRVGQNATVTTFFEAELRAAEALRDLQRAAEREPSVAAFMDLAEAYWQLEDATGAETAYRRVLLQAEAEGSGLAPALAYRRLALLAAGNDLELARDYLLQARQSDPTDAETLFGLAELHFALGDLDRSAEAFRAYLATPAGAGDVEAEERLALVERLGPALADLFADRNPATLQAVGDVFWAEGAIDQAVEAYFEILTQHDPRHAHALARTGQLLFLRGRSDDAIAVLERAADAAGGLEALEPQASLFLGNARFSQGDDAGAIEAWQAHVSVVGEERAGRVPALIATAEARSRGEAVDPAATTATRPTTAAGAGAAAGDGAGGAELLAASRAELAAAALDDPALLDTLGGELYALHCAVCHGAEGEGGMGGPRLAGNRRAGQETNVRSAITFGRGIMPGFGALLERDEIEVLVRWLGSELATPR
jgi:mono/diheme cytochrome c family protein